MSRHHAFIFTLLGLVGTAIGCGEEDYASRCESAGGAVIEDPKGCLITQSSLQTNGPGVDDGGGFVKKDDPCTNLGETPHRHQTALGVVCSSEEDSSKVEEQVKCEADPSNCSVNQPADYWSPTLSKGSESVGKQRNTTIDVKLEIETRDAQSNGAIEFRVCKYHNQIPNFLGNPIHVHYVNQYAPNQDTTLFEGPINTNASSNCTSWSKINPSFNAGQKIGGTARIVSPASSASEWSNLCTPSANAGGSCWLILDTGSMTRTSK